ncbi:hypothetical protein ACTFIU_003751 [Dictyostelium citrinum]
MTTHNSTNVDVELIRYIAESAIILTVNAQASLGCICLIQVNGSVGSVSSGSNTSKSASGTNNGFQKNKK